MKRILFVDDEKNVLDGLRRSLRGRRKTWEMVFAEGGEAALRELEAGSFDAVVSDMRMPGIDGAEVLRIAKEKHPDMARIVLSGQCDQETALKTVPTAHQFLSKPCEAEELQSVIERTCALREMLGDDGVRSVVGSVDALPALPAVYEELERRLADPEVCSSEIADVIAEDVAISAKVLQVVNSSFFGIPQKISDVHGAVSYLGIKTVQSIVLTVEVFRPYEQARCAEDFSLEWLQKHSHLTARIARELVPGRKEKDEAAFAGMVHDIGKLVLATGETSRYEEALAVAAAEGVPVEQVERRVIGAGHAEIGAYLLGLWGLPTAVVEAVAFHHELPVEVEPSRLARALRAADELANAVLPAPSVVHVPTADVLEGLDVEGDFDDWLLRAGEIAEGKQA